MDFVSRFTAEDGELPFLLRRDDVTDLLNVSTACDATEFPLDLSSSKNLPRFLKALIIRKLKIIKMRKGRYDVITALII